MRKADRQSVFMVFYVVPILLCLIGAGAFLHLVLAPVSPTASAEGPAVRQEDDLAALRQKVAAMEALLRQMEALRSERGTREKERQDLAKKLREAEDLHHRLLSERDRVKHETQPGPRTYSVTALNAGGARRNTPALFAECAARGVTLQPVGKALSSKMESGEQESFLSLARQTGHVVFLVRPDGFESFHGYRSLLMSENRRSSRTIEMGLEPVDADWSLKYPGKEG